MAGEVSFVEIGVDDVERGRAFYQGLLGWEFQPGPSGNGFVISAPNLAGGMHGGDPQANPTSSSPSTTWTQPCKGSASSAARWTTQTSKAMRRQPQDSDASCCAATTRAHRLGFASRLRPPERAPLSGGTPLGGTNSVRAEPLARARSASDVPTSARQRGSPSTAPPVIGRGGARPPSQPPSRGSRQGNAAGAPRSRMG